MEPRPDLTLPQTLDTSKQILKEHLRQRLLWLKSFRLRGNDAHRRTCELLLRRVREQPGQVFSLLQDPSISTPIRLHNSDALTDGVRASWRKRVESAMDGAPRERGKPVEGQIRLVLDDDNPLAHQEAHPDKSGNRPDLGDHTESEWIDQLQAALALVENGLPLVRKEIDLFIKRIVPVGYFDEQHLSASYQEAIGTIYLSLHPNPVTMAEALVHEFSHTKLNSVVDLDPILLNDPEEAYASPVRPDPRPIFGVLLAVHAFVPVAALLEALISRADRADLAPRLEQVRSNNREGLSVLQKHARGTAVGDALLGELSGLI